MPLWNDEAYAVGEFLFPKYELIRLLSGRGHIKPVVSLSKKLLYISDWDIDWLIVNKFDSVFSDKNGVDKMIINIENKIIM